MTFTESWGNPTVQFGSAEGPTSIWTPIAFGAATVLLDATAGINRRAGFVFDASLQQTYASDSVGNLLDLPIVTGLTLSATIVVPTAFEGGGTDNAVEVLLVPDARPVDFASGSLAPLNRNEVRLGSFPLSLPAFPGSVVSTLTLDDLTLRALVTSRGYWQGRIALVVRATGTSTLRISNSSTEPMLLGTTQEPFFGGLTGGPAGRVRAVRDSRFGMPAFSPELVRDGDNPGLFVRPFDVDPEDPEATYQPKPTEGTVTDEVPS